MVGHGFVTKILIALLIFRYGPKLSKKFIKKKIHFTSYSLINALLFVTDWIFAKSWLLVDIVSPNPFKTYWLSRMNKFLHRRSQIVIKSQKVRITDPKGVFRWFVEKEGQAMSPIQKIVWQEMGVDDSGTVSKPFEFNITYLLSRSGLCNQYQIFYESTAIFI